MCTVRKKFATLFCLFAILLNVFAVNCSAAFADVTGREWYADGVTFVVSNNLMTGTSANSFDPEGLVTRGMMVTVLYRLSGSKLTGANPFYDVQPGMYFRNAVTWAYKNGIAGGITQYLFCPDEQISREQMAAMLYRYASALKISTKASNQLSNYKDGHLTSSYAITAMNWAIQNGIIKGSEGNCLNPSAGVSRAQLAVVLNRYCNTWSISLPRSSGGNNTMVVLNSAGVPNFQYPMKGYYRVSSGYGYRNCPFHGYELHSGTDFPAPAGTKILASAPGKIVFAGEQGSYGKLVKIDHGNGYVTYYAHNSEILVKVGQLVKTGDTIAKCGMTGSATGNHCHFEIRYNGKAIDPMTILPKTSTGTMTAIVLEEALESSVVAEAPVAEETKAEAPAAEEAKAE